MKQYVFCKAIHFELKDIFCMKLYFMKMFLCVKKIVLHLVTNLNFFYRIIMKIELPQLFVQNDWYLVISESSSSFWVSCSIEGAPSIYGMINSWMKDGAVELIASNGFEVQLVRKGVLMVKSLDFNITTYFFSPIKEFNNIHKSYVRCMDLSPSGSLAVSCSYGALCVWQTDDGLTRRTLDGHFGDPSHCRFFPSGVVVLSGGDDMLLKIWSTEDGSCPVTLIKHKGACSRDGRAFLWDCSSAKCIATLLESETVLNCCSLISYGSSFQNNERSQFEYGTDGKMLVVGQESGYVQAVDVSSKTKVYSLNCDSPVNDCCFASENKLITGHQDGRINLFDIRHTTSPLYDYKCGKSSVKCLERLSDDSILIGREDGSCSCIQMNDISVTIEMSGPNCDSIYNVSSNSPFVYTACRDKVIRKYKMDIKT
ncbi:proteasomal ATPase-associated factor 1 isoform X2 [Hydra vulgaris]|uniref:proteasomal ATPase-associated factor 1 isoform X2 n=1 Tax=Hydra vulgaris TaxID=6087 RepID=UPI0032E9FDB2